MISDKKKLEEFTEEEFLNFVRTIGDIPPGLPEDEYDDYLTAQIRFFEDITEHPSKSDLLFYPRKGVEASAEGILQEVKEWIEKSGSAGFKSS